MAFYECQSVCGNGSTNQLKILIRSLMDVWREFKLGPTSLSTTKNIIFHGSVTPWYAENILIGQANASFSETVDRSCSKRITTHHKAALPALREKPQTQYWFEAWLTPVTVLSREGTLKKTYSVNGSPRGPERQMGLRRIKNKCNLIEWKEKAKKKIKKEEAGMQRQCCRGRKWKTKAWR